MGLAAERWHLEPHGRAFGVRRRRLRATTVAHWSQTLIDTVAQFRVLQSSFAAQGSQTRETELFGLVPPVTPALAMSSSI
jgi:hypothetical protein